MKTWLPALLALVASVSQAYAATASGVPLPVALGILALLVAIVAILWAGVGIIYLIKWIWVKAGWVEKSRVRKAKAEQIAPAIEHLKMRELLAKSGVGVAYDYDVTIISVVANGLLLILTYKVETPGLKVTAPAFLERQKRALIDSYKSNKADVEAVKLGAVYRYKYCDPQGKLLGEFDITSADLG